jgi:hypothetical protein
LRVYDDIAKEAIDHSIGHESGPMYICPNARFR